MNSENPRQEIVEAVACPGRSGTEPANLCVDVLSLMNSTLMSMDAIVIITGLDAIDHSQDIERPRRMNIEHRFHWCDLLRRSLEDLVLHVPPLFQFQLVV